MKNNSKRHALRTLSASGIAAALLCSVVVLGASAGSATAIKHKHHKAPHPTTTTTLPSATTPIALTSPVIPGVAALPGAVVPAPTIATAPNELTVKPSSGTIGTSITISGASLPANASISLFWTTAKATWVVGANPSTVNCLGTKYTPIDVLLDTITTTASGTFTLAINAPQDFGGSHQLYAVVNGVALAEGSFTTLRTVTMTPSSGPIGTPITITYSGLGASAYTGGASLLYDNHYVGEMMGMWTRGVATATIRAAGPVGPHTLQIGNAISYLYLNVPQSPIPYTNGAIETFNVTADNGAPMASLDAPDSVQPTLAQITTLAKGALGVSSKVKVSSSVSSGVEGTAVTVSASSLASDSPVTLQWATVVGNRVNCTSTCWAFATSPLATIAPVANALATPVTVPSPTLGGWHAIQLVQNNKVVAQVPFYVKESIIGYEAAGSTTSQTSLTVTEGQPFSIHIEGIGWTQLDNTVAVDYDNSYVGYGCGFNSNGDVVLNLIATGAPGTHIIDLYPMLYTLSPSFAGAEYGMVPVLSYANDLPGLAMGYDLGAFRFAITVVAPTN